MTWGAECAMLWLSNGRSVKEKNKGAAALENDGDDDGDGEGEGVK